eukprot:CAMPEP_0184328940 /NCGR_PEP_ID=MMETSP1049-20130417/143887_1 /TAXON_ID=77928 /ORGANISM="Proteomonas sulcata, Strain CCMP704" /LENGTH=372 /DNA_ID=CAMNT_0026651279 /DNA_START=87 /DNA_END=1205 /DNA_ORIENTATION=+
MAAQAAAKLSKLTPASRNSRFGSALGSLGLIGAICLLVSLCSHLGSDPVEDLEEGRRQVEFKRLPGGEIEFGYSPSHAQQSTAGAQSMLTRTYGAAPVQVRQLGQGQVEMGYASGQHGRSAGRGSNDFRPAGEAYAEGYRFARLAAPEVMSQGYFSDPVRGHQVLQAEPQTLSPLSAAAPPPAAQVSAEAFSKMSAQLASMHQQEQQKLASDQAQENQMLQNAAMDPVVVANAVMRDQAAALEQEYGGYRGPQAAPAVIAAKSRVQALAQARQQQLAEVPASMMGASNEPQGGPPTERDQPVPSDNVAIQALQARLQADEVAISTLTKDVNELREQNEELQASAQSSAEAASAAPTPAAAETALQEQPHEQA